MLKITKNKRGFTLIEIIVVLVILGILASALIPSLLGYVKNAKRIECMNSIGILQRNYSSSLLNQKYATSDPNNYLKAFDNTLYSVYMVHMDENHEAHDICNEGGVYTATFNEKGDITIHCSIHGEIEGTTGTTETKVSQYLSNFISSHQGGQSLDSGNSSGYSPELIEALKNAGYSENYLEQSIWYFDVGNKAFYMGLKENIQEENNGDRTLVVNKYLIIEKTSTTEKVKLQLLTNSAGETYEAIFPTGRN